MVNQYHGVQIVLHLILDKYVFCMYTLFLGNQIKTNPFGETLVSLLCNTRYTFFCYTSIHHIISIKLKFTMNIIFIVVLDR